MESLRTPPPTGCLLPKRSLVSSSRADKGLHNGFRPGRWLAAVTNSFCWTSHWSMLRHGNPVGQAPLAYDKFLLKPCRECHVRQFFAPCRCSDGYQNCIFVHDVGIGVAGRAKSWAIFHPALLGRSWALRCGLEPASDTKTGIEHNATCQM